MRISKTKLVTYIKSLNIQVDKCETCPSVCCVLAGEVEVTDKEITSICELGDYKKNFNLKKRLIKQGPFGVCPFLNKNTQCSIYENRPKVCIDYDCEGDTVIEQLKSLIIEGEEL
jgi:Fe-S-cluster containining protein